MAVTILHYVEHLYNSSKKLGSLNKMILPFDPDSNQKREKQKSFLTYYLLFFAKFLKIPNFATS